MKCPKCGKVSFALHPRMSDNYASQSNLQLHRDGSVLINNQPFRFENGMWYALPLNEWKQERLREMGFASPPVEMESIETGLVRT